MTVKKTRNKLYFILVLVFIATLGTLIYIVHSKTNNIIEAQTVKQAQTANRAFANYLGELEERAMQHADLIANEENIKDLIKNGNYESLKKELMKLLLNIDFASICDDKGIMLARTHSNLTGDIISGNVVSVLKVLQTGKKAGSISLVPTTNNLAVCASVPVYDGNTLLGIVTCNYDLTKNEYVDIFKERTGCEATIFLDNERISTTITDQGGNRVMGTKMDYDFVTGTVIGQKKEYIGELEVYGTLYGACYSPVISGEEAVGMLFTGIDINTTIENQRGMNYWIILTAIIGIAASVVFLAFLSHTTRRHTLELEKELKQQALMADISRTFLTDTDTDTLVTNTLNMVGEFMKIPQTLLFFINEDQSATCRNEYIDPALGFKSRIGDKMILKGPMLSILENLKPGIGNDSCMTSNDPGFKKAMSPYRVNFKNYIATPVFVKGKIHALIDFSRKDDGKDWNESEINLATFFASTLSGVFERDAMERQTSIVENSPDIIFYLDRNGNLAYANPAVSLASGYTVKEIIAGGFGLLFDEQTVRDIKEKYVPQTLLNSIDTGEIILQCRNGQKKILAIKSFIAKDGIIATIAYDLTEIRELESELITAKNTAEKASHAKSEFLSRMSHEMRTPMNAIIGLTELAKETNDLDKLKSFLEKTIGASKHLLTIIDDIMDMTVIESGNFRMYYKEFNLEKMFVDIVKIINFSVNEKKQHLAVNIDKSLPLVIVFDERRFQQVIINILSNAVKFTPEGGNITLNANVADISNEMYTILVEVIDNGIGIGKEEQKNLFMPFEQIDGGVARKYGGTGLGLYICKQIVQQSDGRIWVESELDHGAKFSFTVKAKIGQEVTAREPLVQNRGGPKSGKILLAEDVEINRLIVEEILSSIGLVSEFAENGQQALDMYKAGRGKYSLILMDINMPEMDGYTATRLIRALDTPDSKNIPIIAMSANIFQEDIDKCLEAGMNDHVGKPIDFSELTNKITKYCGITEKTA